MKKLMLASLLSAAALAVPGTAVAGLVWNESGPGAGELLGSAQVVVGSQFTSLDAITGTLNSSVPLNGTPRYQVDLFKIRIDDIATFSARTVGSDFDTALYLFDSSGFGVYTNDDNGLDFLSLLPAGDPHGPSGPADYFLAIAFGGFVAIDALDQSIFQSGNFTDVLGPNPGATALAGWTDSYSTLTESPLQYRIELTGATNGEVPEPATLTLVLAACAGVCAARARPRPFATAGLPEGQHHA